MRKLHSATYECGHNAWGSAVPSHCAICGKPSVPTPREARDPLEAAIAAHQKARLWNYANQRESLRAAFEAYLRARAEQRDEMGWHIDANVFRDEAAELARGSKP